MMRLLITGATGQIGKALHSLVNPLHTVLTPGRSGFDLSTPSLLPGVLDSLAPDLIINAAAYTAVDRAEDEGEIAWRVNAEAPATIAVWCAKSGVPLVHFSTDYVFDGSGDQPWREDSQPNPLSVYGVTKLAGESSVRGSKAPHLIVRTSWVYAAKGTNFLRTIVRLAQERPQLKIVADQIGAPTSARLIARIVSQIILEHPTNLMQRFAESAGIVNIAASGETSWYGFATHIFAGLRSRGVALKVEEIVPIQSHDYPTRVKRPRNSRFDLARLKTVFGIIAPPWQESLDTELSQFIDQLNSAPK